MEYSTLTQQEIKEKEKEFRQNIKPLKRYTAESIFIPLKQNQGIVFGKNIKFEYKKSKTFGTVKVFYSNKTRQEVINPEYFGNERKLIKAGEYEQAYHSISVHCENGFNFKYEIKVDNAYTKLTEEDIKKELRPIFERKLLELKKNKIINNIDNLINSFQNEEREFLSIDY